MNRLKKRIFDINDQLLTCGYAKMIQLKGHKEAIKYQLDHKFKNTKGLLYRIDNADLVIRAKDYLHRIKLENLEIEAYIDIVSTAGLPVEDPTATTKYLIKIHIKDFINKKNDYIKDIPLKDLREGKAIFRYLLKFKAHDIPVSLCDHRTRCYLSDLEDIRWL